MPQMKAPIESLEDPVWERQSNETPVAYAAFRAYRDLGPGRTIDRARDVLLEKWKDIATRRSDSRASKGPYTSRIGHWASMNHWLLRAAAYDAHIDHLLMDERELATREASKQLEARAQRLRDIEMDIGEQAMRNILEVLQMPATEKVVSEDGTTHIHPNPTIAKIAPQLLREADRVVRLAMGLPTEGARMPTPPFDTGDTSDVDQFFKSLRGEAAPSAELPDPVEPS